MDQTINDKLATFARTRHRWELGQILNRHEEGKTFDVFLINPNESLTPGPAGDWDRNILHVELSTILEWYQVRGYGGPIESAIKMPMALDAGYLTILMEQVPDKGTSIIEIPVEALERIYDYQKSKGVARVLTNHQYYV